MSNPDGQELYQRSAIQQHLQLEPVIDRVRDALGAYARGKAQMPAKNYLFFDEHDGDLRTMSAYIEEFDLATVKVVNAHPNNRQRHNLPTVMALLVAVNPSTGYPKAVMDATEITALRTAAASAVATDVCTPEQVSVLGVIGAGDQASYQIRGQFQVRSFDELWVYDLDQQRARELSNRALRLQDDLHVRVVESPRLMISQCDVVISITPSTEPLIPPVDPPERLHINAMGADGPGKQEWPGEWLDEFAVIVDDWAQASHSGEVNKRVQEGSFSESDCFGTLGEIIVEPPDSMPDRTLFDSTGLAIQDNAAAAALLESDAEPDTHFDFLS